MLPRISHVFSISGAKKVVDLAGTVESIQRELQVLIARREQVEKSVALGGTIEAACRLERKGVDENNLSSDTDGIQKSTCVR